MIAPQADSYRADTIARALSSSTIFSAAQPETIASLARIATPRYVPARESLVEQGARWPFLGVVCSGRIFAILGTDDGRELIVNHIPPPESFGYAALMDGGPSFVRFASLWEPAETLQLPREPLLAAAAADPGLALGIARRGAMWTRSTAELLSAHLSKPVISRIATTLLAHGDERRAGLAPIPADRRLRLAYVAAASGAAKEVAARALSRLERHGAIKRERREIAFVDTAKLREFEQGG